jgi:DNA polymerase-4
VEPVYFHVDLDAFFASVEQTDNPDLRGKPVIIGAAPGHRGVVAACSYEARTFGVHSAMPISEAYRRCPQGVYLPVRMNRYHELSTKVMSLFGDFTPKVQQISVDEASLDMTGTERLLGPPETSARAIKERVRTETGLTISVGVAPNRYLAKLASEYKKPDGLYRVLEGAETAFLDTLELSDLWGLGKKTRARLQELGITSVRKLRSESLQDLRSKVGQGSGSYLYTIVRGRDPGIYSEERKTHSISNEHTFEHDTADSDKIRRTMLSLSHEVMFRMIDEEIRPKTVFIKVRFSDFRTTTVQRTLSRPPAAAEELFSYALELLNGRWRGEPLRLLGVGVSATSDTQRSDGYQGELFDDAPGTIGDKPHPSTEKRRRLEETVFKMKRHGNQLTKASLLDRDKKSEGAAE